MNEQYTGFRCTYGPIGVRTIRVTGEISDQALFAPATAAILRAAGFAAGQRVLDVGCGSGTLLKAAIATGASVVGVDISPVMAEAAGKRVPEATVMVDYAQTADLNRLPQAPFNRIVSRFGVMFFADPVAAFVNLVAPRQRTDA